MLCMYLNYLYVIIPFSSDPGLRISGISSTTSSSSSWGHFQAKCDMKSLQCVLDLPQDLLPVGNAQNTSTGRRLRGA